MFIENINCSEKFATRAEVGGGGGGSPPQFVDKQSQSGSVFANKASRAIFASQSGNIGLL